jgi:hypothetical protein
MMARQAENLSYEKTKSQGRESNSDAKSGGENAKLPEVLAG